MAESSASKTSKSKTTQAKPAKSPDVGLYDRISARSSTTILEASRKARDIAPCPEIEGRKRRDLAAASLLSYLETCHPATFPLAWSDDHRRVIARLQDTIERGGQFALAMPRGSGKTSLVE